MNTASISWEDFCTTYFLIPPRTEFEFWKVMEHLGNQGHQMLQASFHNHGLKERDRQSMMAASMNIRDIQKRLAEEICQRFNLVPVEECPPWTRSCQTGEEYIDYFLPRVDNQWQKRIAGPAAPEGKTYYWHWYNHWKQEWIREDFKTMICQACPYAKTPNGREVPCGRHNGWISRLHHPYQCAKMEDANGMFSPERMEAILEEMEVDHGRKAVEDWLHMRDLMIMGLVMKNGTYTADLNGARGRTRDGHPFFVDFADHGWRIMVYDQGHTTIGFDGRPQFPWARPGEKIPPLLEQKGLKITLEQAAILAANTDVSADYISSQE